MYKQDNFDYDRFGLAVKSGRVLNSLRQEDLAKELGCVRSTVSKCERGMAIDPRIMIAICIRFKLNILDYCITNEIH